MINRNQMIDNFEQEYQARIAKSSSIRIKNKRLESFMNGDSNDLVAQDTYETVDAVEIVMPRDKLQKLLESQMSSIYTRQFQERKLRDEYPALQNAWEQYQTMLAMITGDSLMNPKDKY